MKKKRAKRIFIEYDKEKLIVLLKEKIDSGELKYLSNISEIKGMPSYRYIKSLWTKEEMKEIFGMKPKVYSYTNGYIISEYYRIKKDYDIITSDIMKRETGICIDSIRTRFGSWNKFLVFLGEKPK